MLASQAMIRPVILSGGAGTRLWPLSTARSPKQFHALGSAIPMLAETALRVQDTGFSPPVVLGNVRHGGRIVDCLAAHGVTPDCIILEPEPRNTAPAIAVAALAARDPDEILAVLPADHLIPGADALRAVLIRAAIAARAERIVTLGLKPTGPETGFGYIRAGEAFGDGVHRVEAFVEKPDQERANHYVASGDYFWNAGIFVFRAGTMIDAFARLRPQTLDAARESLARARTAQNVVSLDAEAFARTHAQSIDYEIMERISNAAVVPVALDWSDIGSWAALWDASPKDNSGNAGGGTGEAVFIDVRDSLIHSTGPAVALVGVEGLAVIATPEGIIVIPKSRAQEVKAVVEEWKRRGRSDLV